MRALSDFDVKTVRRRYVCLGILVLVGVMVSIVIYGIVSAASHSEASTSLMSSTVEPAIGNSIGLNPTETPQFASSPHTVAAEEEEGGAAKNDDKHETTTSAEPPTIANISTIEQESTSKSEDQSPHSEKPETITQSTTESTGTHEQSDPGNK